MSTRYFEDYTVGEVFHPPSASLDEETIVAFARDYDSQPIHIDKAYAEAGPYGGLIASGFQTIALAFNQFLKLGFLVDVSLGGPGMDETRWLKPVRPGDVLSPTVTVLSARRLNSKPDRGAVQFGFEVRNQKDETVLTFKSMTFIQARTVPPADGVD